MPKPERLEDVLAAEMPLEPQYKLKWHSFPERWAQKDFPLLFPKMDSDEHAIRRIAQWIGIDYDLIQQELKQLETPEPNHAVFRKRWRAFKETYGRLWDAVRYVGEDYGITLNDYGIQKKVSASQISAPRN